MSTAQTKSVNANEGFRTPLKILFNCIALFCSFAIPYYCEYSIHEWRTLTIYFYVCLFALVISWSSGVSLFVRSASIFSFLFRILWSQQPLSNEFQYNQLFISAIFASILFYLTTFHKKSINLFNDFKTVAFDWFFIIPLFPIAAILDLFFQTNLFFMVVAYFCGNFIAFIISNIAQRVWTYFLDLGDNENQEWYYINLFRTSRSSQSKLHMRSLIALIWLSAFLLFECTSRRNLNILQDYRVDLGFAIGIFSTLTCYLGPIAGAAFLSDSELRHVLDHSVLVQMGKTQTTSASSRSTANANKPHSQ